MPANLHDDRSSDATSEAAATNEQLILRVRMLGRRLERAENEARDLRRSGGGGGSPTSDGRADALQRRIDELESSTSWRVAKYLREAKTLSARARPVAARLARGRLSAGSDGAAAGATDASPAPAPTAGLRTGGAFNYFSREADEALLQSRLRVVAAGLGLAVAHSDDTSPVTPEERLEAEAPRTRSAWWLIAVGYLGSLPSDDLLELLLDDAEAGRLELAFARLRSARAQSTGQWQVTAPLRLVEGPLIDATFAATTALHTGVQRVVRNTVPVWVQRAGDATLAVLDPAARAWRAPTGAERHRLLEWDDSLLGREPAGDDALPSEVLVPWRTVVVIPELKPKGDLESLRAMASSGANELAAIVYDLIPVSAGEFVPEGVTASFGTYISMIKYSTRVSAISESAAVEFEAMDAVFQAQGIRGPLVRAHQLPLVPPPPATDPGRITALRRSPDVPLVLQVGSIGPHKNQRATLAAATALWDAGTEFEVIFVAPNSWDSGDFALGIREQQEAGRAVSAVNGISEEQLWALYRAAHVVVLPSYVEGYGLPIAEALSVGTPVITSDFGSMAEIARGNGSLLVAPRDHQALAAALSTVLTDTAAYARLKSEAEGVVPSSWSAYADAVWAWLSRGEDD
ncbi:glycosyltransferase [Subtercola boreus]|uniref:glycosyltransferase n=1 Tax=Subtercola boreus TaxID=120213 RepID=UPI0011C0569F|nr:glycosyltransferase [Subtercola boreus]